MLLSFRGYDHHRYRRSEEHIAYDEWGGETMLRLDDGWCSAVDRETLMCTIYENRPWICREFEMGSFECVEQRTDVMG